MARTLKEFEEERAKWPTGDEEGPNARAIRQSPESKRPWGERYGPALAEGSQDTEVSVDPNESRITSRPWFRWDLEVGEEAKRLDRAQRLDLPVEKKAKVNAKARWQAQGDWKDTWSDTPRWKWRHESPSPEPEDPNDMDFSPSEIDALDAIPPPTPPPTLPIKSAPISDIRGLFSATLSTGTTTAVQPVASAGQHKVENHDAAGERRPSEGPDTQQCDRHSPDVSAEDQSERGFVARQRQSQKQKSRQHQSQLSHSSTALPTARTLRKRKRNGEDEACNNIEPSSTEMTQPAAPGRAKRPRTAPLSQANQSLGLNAKSTRKPASEEHVRQNPDQHAADPVGALQAAEARRGPRRSSRIRARRGTSQSTVHDERVESFSVNDGNAHKKPSRPRKRVETTVLTNGSVPQSITKARTGQ